MRVTHTRKSIGGCSNGIADEHKIESLPIRHTSEASPAQRHHSVLKASAWRHTSLREQNVSLTGTPVGANCAAGNTWKRAEAAKMAQPAHKCTRYLNSLRTSTGVTCSSQVWFGERASCALWRNSQPQSDESV